MDGKSEHPGVHHWFLPPSNVRILESEEELAAAVARASEGARRLEERLAARAARDAWMAEHTEQRVGWLRLVRAAKRGTPTSELAATRHDDATSRPKSVTSNPPAA